MGQYSCEWFPHGTISSGVMVIAADLNGYKIDEIVSVTLPSAQTVSKVFDGGQNRPPQPSPILQDISMGSA